MMTKTKALHDFFLEQEKALELFSKTHRGICFWELVRTDVSFYLQRKIGLGFNQSAPKSFLFFVKNLYHFFKNVILRNPFFNLEQKEYLVFAHSRKVLHKGEYIDIYTYFLKNELSMDNTEFYSSTNIDLSKQNQMYKPIDFFKFVTKVSILLPLKFSAETNVLIKKLEDSFSCKIEKSVKLDKIIKRQLKAFILKKKLYKLFFKIKKPKDIFLVTHYSHKGLIAAAKELNIKTTEIQHGTMSKQHLGYHFPTLHEPLRYFPDKFYAFGEHWINSVNFPLKSSDVTLYGFPYLNELKSIYSTEKQSQDSILMISQGSIGKQLSEFAIRLAEKLPGKKIYYKLHPGEYHEWRKRYPNLVNNQYPNLKVLDNNYDCNLYSLFASCNFILGVYSTALYEALVFNCKVILLNLPGVENMEELLKTGTVVKANKISEIYDFIENYPILKKDKLNLIFKETE